MNLYIFFFKVFVLDLIFIIWIYFNYLDFLVLGNEDDGVFFFFYFYLSSNEFFNLFLCKVIFILFV